MSYTSIVRQKLRWKTVETERFNLALGQNGGLVEVRHFTKFNVKITDLLSSESLLDLGDAQADPHCGLTQNSVKNRGQ